MADLTSWHDDPACYRQIVVLKEFMFLQTETRKDLAVVRENLDCVEIRLRLIWKPIWWENDALTQEVAQDVLDRNELDLPAHRFQHVLFLGDKLIVVERDTDVVEQLTDPRISLLHVLGADKETAKCDHSHDVVFALVPEVRKRVNVRLYITSHHVGIEKVYRVVVSLWLDTELFSQVVHPINKHFSVTQIECCWVVGTI